MEERNKFLNKHVKVTKEDGFVLYGKLVDKELFGIWLESDTETSFITYNNIKDIRLDPRYNQTMDGGR